MKSQKELVLREVREEDSETLFKWINNKKLVNFNSHYQPISRKSHDQWFSNIQNREDFIIFSIVLLLNKSEETLIGTTSLRNIDLINRKAEFQIRIGDCSELNKGWGSKTIIEILKFAFLNLNLNRVYLDVFETNVRAKKAYEKCGFKLEGIKKKDAFIEGKYVNVFIMAILKENFKTNI